jgi:hypothetical protein
MNILIFSLWLFLSLVAANIAQNKGNSGLLTFIASLILSPLFGFLMCLSKPNQAVLDNRALKSGRLKRCPYCAELIKSKALLCHYCDKEQPNQQAETPNE